MNTTAVVARESWGVWQCGVVAEIRDGFRGILDHIDERDIDWDAWRPLYEQGCSPRVAVDRAYLRDL